MATKLKAWRVEWRQRKDAPDVKFTCSERGMGIELNPTTIRHAVVLAESGDEAIEKAKATNEGLFLLQGLEWLTNIDLM